MAFDKDKRTIELLQGQRTNSFSLDKKENSFTILNSSVFSGAKLRIRKSDILVTIEGDKEQYITDNYPFILTSYNGEIMEFNMPQSIEYNLTGSDAIRFEVEGGDIDTSIIIAGFFNDPIVVNI